ncbi:hypothetical protein EW026_g5511 [Hermanssonia centrifuga]|uniref:Asteroid domain-containing protein n=1 Tax=Hermanssonia centrifuga TaxID=98765 RepID=A0A4S4KDW3_9APHY|nr:hypothetical protein EW026_g5511 [Hermanssonia centrifuga]
MLPPGMYTACVQALQRLSKTIGRHDGTPNVLEIHFADEEGDPYAVELAARLGGYVVGKDSDFVVLNSDGYLGYVPLDEMVWTGLQLEVDVVAEEDDGFQTVVNSKAKKKAALLQRAGVGHGIIPPEDSRELQLTVATYSPSTLASHLQIPLSLLPLLGALVGNDFTGSRDSSSATTAQETNLQWLFFERQLTLSQRITRVASAIKNLLAAALSPSPKNKQKQVHSVMELIERSVAALIVRPLDTISSGERAKVVERIVEATLQYAIPKYESDVPGPDSLWSSGICALHEVDACPLVQYISHSDTAAVLELASPAHDARTLYIQAYRAGRLDPHTLDIMHSGTFWYRQFLENPDLETVSRSIGRPIQIWSYALLDDALGLPENLDDDDLSVGEETVVSREEAEEAEDEDDDEDELIDVVEESDEEDPLAPLRGVLEKLNGPADGITTEPTASISSQSRDSRLSKSKSIVEYIRRGTRLAPEEVIVPSLAQLLPNTVDLEDSDIPVQLRSPDERFTFLLRILDSDHVLIRTLPAEQRIVVLTVRWVVLRMHLRAQESNSNKDRAKERWTKEEVQAFLASFSWAAPLDLEAAEEPVPITDRNVQLVSQISVALDAIERLSQVLLLCEQLPSPVLRFSGRLFHSYLTGFKKLVPEAIPDRLWHASIEQLNYALGESTAKNRKREKRKENVNGSTNVPERSTKSKGMVVLGGKFGLLASLDS